MNIRPFVEDDAPAIAALISADEERFYGRPGRLTGEDILMFLPYNKEAWVWEEDGCVVASALFGVHGEAVNLRGFVAKKGCGLGTEIVDRDRSERAAVGTASAQQAHSSAFSKATPHVSTYMPTRS